MALLVDTSVWSAAFRRDAPAESPEVVELKRALGGAELIVTTGIILQELLQGLVRPSSRTEIIDRFVRVPLVQPSREDHTAAADHRNTCRKAGVQLGTVDALIAQIAIGRDHTLLSMNRDFRHASAHIGLRLSSL